MSESSLKPELSTFCSFFISDFEVALPMEIVQEIVNYPEKVTPVPMTPSYCEGIFNLRGMIIPLIHLSDLLGQERKATQYQKVVITHYHNIKIGLLVDSTNEILKIHPHQREDVVYQESSPHSIVKGILKMGNGERLLHVLDPEVLIKLEDIPHVVSKILASSGQDNQKQAMDKRTKGITFTVSGTSLFLHMADIFEIIQPQKFERCFVNYPFAKGLVNLRGMIIPVIELNEFLEGQENSMQDGRIIILKLDHGQKLGLLVNSVDQIMSYGAKDVLPVPSVHNKDLYQGLLSLSGEKGILILEAGFFLKHQEIFHVIDGHAKLGLSAKEDKKIRKTGKETYISFKMREEYCFPILDIQEIIPFPQDYTTVPGSSSHLLGIYNLRGRPVTLLNLQANIPEDPKVIILKKDEDYLGLVVESVEDIFSIYSQDKFPCPTLFKSEQENRLSKAVKEIVIVNNEVTKNKKLVVFKMEEFFNPALYAA